MSGHDILVIGASAGGVQTLRELVARLPGGLAAAVFVVVHFPTDRESILPSILDGSGGLPAAHARDGEPIESGRIYIAPPNRHMTLEPDRVVVEWGPRINHCRPAIDPLFRSAARSYGNRVIGLLLSGMLNDGSSGILAIEKAGGLAVVQDPDDALFPEMPANARAILENPIVRPLSAMAPTLLNLVNSPPGGSPAMKDRIDEIHLRAEQDIAAQERGERQGAITVLTCPDCGGVLWQLNDQGLLEFRCHTGHVMTAESATRGQAEFLEKALEVTLRALREREVLSHQLASRARSSGEVERAEVFQRRAALARRHGQLVKAMLRENDEQMGPVPQGAADPASL